MTLTVINELTESKLFRHSHILQNLGPDGIKDLTFLYVLALYIMYNEPETHKKAISYAKKTKSYRDFKQFYIGGTDLYLLINTLTTDKKTYSDKWPFNTKVNKASIKKPLLLMFLDRLANAKIERKFVHSFLFDFQNSLKITNGTLRSLRRYVQDWHLMDVARKRQTMLKIKSYMKTKAMHTEIYNDIIEISRKYDLEDK